MNNGPSKALAQIFNEIEGDRNSVQHYKRGHLILWILDYLKRCTVN